ncbi:uncharacterized protein B0H18DRAFT_600953 [Fomitopsis serialis]|uniref:uncharacterized protein n=1 Tax=Fomitopsis serialis TaxID=139415 RepID=UPI0020082F44|nr:uncharacterized protein B0H18DRAFT_600953 [Neoantrodia serialis]KAH9933768.1 hypothetical protein B0H18DRAFT_600953 [Neoantrodia serialis]
MGNALVAVLSNHQYPLSKASEASSLPSGNSLQHDDSVGTTINSIGCMVLDTFIQAQTDDDDDNQALHSDSDYRMLAGLIRAMPLAHGTKACMRLFQHLHNDQLSTKKRRATLDVVQNIYVTLDFLAEDSGYSPRPGMQDTRTHDCAPHTELYRLRDVQDWEYMQTALTTVYACRDSVSTIEIATTVLATCILSVKKEHTLPSEPLRGAYLADMLQQFDKHLATLRRKEMQDTVKQLPFAAVYRLDWVLAYITYDIYWSLDSPEIRRNAMKSANSIVRRLQWLLECNEWMSPGTVTVQELPVLVDLQEYVDSAQWRLRRVRIDPELERCTEWLECTADEPQGQGDRRVDSPHAADPAPTSEAVDEQDTPEQRTDSPIRSIVQFVLRRTAVQEPDVEMRAVDTSPSAAPDVPGTTDTAPPAASRAPLVTATTLGEQPQEQFAAQTGLAQSLDYITPQADDSEVSRGVAEHGADADEGRKGGFTGTTEHADEHRGSNARPSQEGLAAPGDSHSESASHNANSG